MGKDKAYYMEKIVSASNGPKMAEILADECSNKLLKLRDGKTNFFTKKTKAKRKQEIENLELAIMKVMRQSKREHSEAYDKVLNRMHETGFDPLFKGKLPISIFDESVQQNYHDYSCQNDTQGNHQNDQFSQTTSTLTTTTTNKEENNNMLLQ